MADFRSIADDIKTTLSSAIAALRMEMRGIVTHVDEMEATALKQGRYVRRLQTAANSHTSSMLTMQRHLEDFDNRGRRHNVHIRRMPETVEPPHLKYTVIGLTTYWIGPQTPQLQFRGYTALRPRVCPPTRPYLLPSGFHT